MVFCFLFLIKIQSPALTMPPLSHLTFCTPTKSNLDLANYLETVVSEPDLYRLPTFHAPNIMSLCVFHNSTSFYGEEFLAPHPTPKLEDHPLPALLDCCSIYSQLPSILEAFPPSIASGRTMPWWHTHSSWAVPNTVLIYMLNNLPNAEKLCMTKCLQ
jgi:hypothetical protein